MHGGRCRVQLSCAIGGASALHTLTRERIFRVMMCATDTASGINRSLLFALCVCVCDCATYVRVCDCA